MLTMTDLFCGAGGSSSGAVQVPGVTVRMAANHWDLAIETHNENHPSTDHDCADISQVEPRRYPKTDLLWASPECTNHSQAKGRKVDTATPDMFGDTLPDAAAQRSRATMWDVVRFAEHHRYRAVIVENVVDVTKWLPFPAWIMAMQSLGYVHQLVWLNSMHAQAAGLPAPQSRDRIYVVFWRKDGNAPDLARWTRPQAWCPSCDRMVAAMQVFKRHDVPNWGRYRAQYLYRCPNATCRHSVVEPGWLPASAAIDWALPGKRIGDRAKPLAPKTVARIQAGLARYGRPVHVEHGGNQYDSADPKHPQHGHPGAYMRAWPVDEPLKVIHTQPTKALAYHQSMLIPVEGREGKTAQPVTEPLRTQTARNETGLLVPAGGTWNDTATHTDEPMRTRTTRDTEALVIPMRANNVAKATSLPFDTFAANGLHHALLMRNNTARGDQGQMSTPVSEPMRTLTTTGHQSLIQWADTLIDFNGPPRALSRELPTQTTVEGDGLLGSYPDVQDCLFRMLEPHEIAAGMAFPPDYTILGNKREQVRQAGNAVTPPAARDLISAVAESLR
jgi:DNA (cytosine-5)-methyltransferase 1